MALKDKDEYNSYMKEYMAKRWKARRKNAIISLGGKCVKCGSENELEFDHSDSTMKSFSISRASSMSEKAFSEELTKCQLLCKICHMEKTISSGDLGDRYRDMLCGCGKVLKSIKSYSGHKRWCNK